VSFSQRYIELGVLRAIGLSLRQMGAFLIVEQLLLILLGAAAGTGLGVGISYLFIPFYQVQIGRYIGTPPMVVEIGWSEVYYVYAVLGAMFLTAVAVLFLSLRRLRVFEAVKLGETT
jgi:putative ABC transport system permease protein